MITPSEKDGGDTYKIALKSKILNDLTFEENSSDTKQIWQISHILNSIKIKQCEDKFYNFSSKS